VREGDSLIQGQEISKLIRVFIDTPAEVSARVEMNETGGIHVAWFSHSVVDRSCEIRGRPNEIDAISHLCDFGQTKVADV
jgi:hypothetical protein